MKKVTLWSIVGIIVVMGVAIGSAFLMGNRSPVVAEGKVVLPDDFKNDATYIKYLFVIVHDADSQRPMPYSAIKIRLGDISERREFSFMLTPENLRAMDVNMMGTEPPKYIRLKARLDKDGVGGADQPGDLVGQIDRVASGKRNLEIKITEKIGLVTNDMVFAKGKVEVDPSFEQEANLIETLYLTVYDDASGMPMPYGAMRVNWQKVKNGFSYEFALTKENLMIMNPAATTPKKLKIKARLDKDGVAGRAKPGDLVGEVKDISLGASNVSILIKEKI